jgi:hypothetical protein
MFLSIGLHLVGNVFPMINTPKFFINTYTPILCIAILRILNLDLLSSNAFQITYELFFLLSITCQGEWPQLVIETIKDDNNYSLCS